jgi:hypothetical protein
MRHIALFVVLTLAGCSSLTSLEELEAEAIETGDWSEVERRERVLREQKRTAEFDCPDGMTLVCIDNGGGGEECLCRRRRILP